VQHAYIKCVNIKNASAPLDHYNKPDLTDPYSASKPVLECLRSELSVQAYQ